jgi:TolA-binding protein
MRNRLLAALLLALAACYPASRGKELEARIDKLDASSQELAKQLQEERDALKQQAGDLQAKEVDLSARLDKLEKASRTSDADVGVQIQSVREDLAKLHGDVDQYQHRIDLLEQSLKQLSESTDEKLAAAKGSDALKQLQAQKEAAQLKRPTDKVEYLKLADEKAASGDAALASTLYGEWLQKWPKDPLAASAHYSLGKLDQDQNHHREALSEFGEVAKNFSKSDKAPPALLRSSESFAALGMADASRLALEALVKDYPKSQEAKIAKERLKKPAPAPKKKGK